MRSWVAVQNILHLLSFYCIRSPLEINVIFVSELLIQGYPVSASASHKCIDIGGYVHSSHISRPLMKKATGTVSVEPCCCIQMVK